MFTDPDITQDVQDNGSFEVFKQYSNGWTNLPDINGKVSVVYNFFVGSFTLIVQTTDGSTITNPGTMTFRTVIVTKQMRQAHPTTDWKNYNQAMEALASSATM